MEKTSRPESKSHPPHRWPGNQKLSQTDMISLKLLEGG